MTHPKHPSLAIKVFRLAAALLIAAGLFSPIGQQTAAAETIIPPVLITCRIEPEVIPVGGQGTLYIDISQVSASVLYNDSVITPSGTNLYNIDLAFTPGALTFHEAAPRRGPAPWNNTFAPAGQHEINNETGYLGGYGMTNPTNVPFSSNPYTTPVNLFYAPFTVNQPGPLPIAVTYVNIPVFGIYTVSFPVEINNCVGNANHTPTVNNALVDQFATEDAAFSYQFAAGTFGDVDPGDTLAYTTSALPGWLSFDPATRTFSGTPANADVGSFPVTVTATDSGALTAADTFTITVANTNDAPVVANAVPNQNATEDALFSYQVPASTFADVDTGDSLTYSTSTLPGWLTFDPATRTFSGTPRNAHVGAVEITVTATDGSAATASDTFTLTVGNTNDAPILANAIPNQNATEDAPFTFQFAANTFTDVDAGDTLTYSAQLAGGGALPAWLSFNPGTRTFSGTPANANVGTISVEVIATDTALVAISDAFDIVVANTNDAPAVSAGIGDTQAYQDVAFTYTFAVDAFNDPDLGDTLAYTTSALPAWLSFDPATRTFSGTPGNADVGSLEITVTATDLSGAFAATSFTLTVNNENDAPSLANALADQTFAEDAPFSFTVPANSFTDPDTGDTLTYSAALSSGVALPAWVTFNPGTRTFSGQANNAQVGSYEIRVTAADGEGQFASDTFTLTITNSNDAPFVQYELADQFALEDAAFSYQVPAGSFSDVDTGDSLAYSASGLPAWLSFNTETRTFSGTPGNADVGEYIITVTATDLAAATASDTFTLSVTNVNDTPTAQPVPAQVALTDAPYAYTLPAGTFTDQDAGDSLTITATGLPNWLSFDSDTLTFSGTPAFADFGSFTVTLRATDEDGLYVELEVDFQVNFNNFPMFLPQVGR